MDNSVLSLLPIEFVLGYRFHVLCNYVGSMI